MNTEKPVVKKEEKLPRGVEKLTPNAEEMAPKLVKFSVVFLGCYFFFHYVLICLSPGVYKYYLRFTRSFEPVMPKDAPKDITPVREVFGVHDYAATREHFGSEVIIFRNYTDCRRTFDKVVYPKRKNQIDTYMKIKYREESPGNAYVPGTHRGQGHVSRKLSEVLSRKDPLEYASFLRIFHGEDYTALLNAKAEDKFEFDSSFISFFDRPIVSTGIHAAPVAQTLSLQCYGTKSWLFWKATDMEKFGIHPVATPHAMVTTGDPESILKIPTKVATAYPGDLMYFPPFYFHAVATNPGKNIMFAIRKIDGESFKMSLKISVRLTWEWILRYAHTQFYNKSGKKGFHEGEQEQPFKDTYEREIFDLHTEVFGHVNSLSEFELP